MAKDNRNREQVPLGKKGPAVSAKKKKSSTGKRVVIALLLILIAVSAVFLIVLGSAVIKTLVSPKKKGPEAVLSSYATTPDAEKNKVAYYVVGLMGPEITSPTDMLAVVCHDKKAKTVRVLQVPADTYMGETEGWDVKTMGRIWGNPAPLPWCETCRKPVYAPEIKDKKHTVCNTEITEKIGSASDNLLRSVNKQFGLPTDQFFILPREAFVKLVNLMSGIDVTLEANMTLEDVEYKKGVQTLGGEAALQYVTTYEYKNTPDSDVQRLLRQRKVITSLLQRLFAKTADELTADSIGPLMGGSTPIRTAAKTAQIVEILTDMAKSPLTEMTYYVLPGESAKSGKTTYFSPHKADAIQLLTESFNPYGRPITETDAHLQELAKKKETDLHKQTFAETSVPQAGRVTTTTTTAATTATKK